jgi:hypothetical protein
MAVRAEITRLVPLLAARRVRITYQAARARLETQVRRIRSEATEVAAAGPAGTHERRLTLVALAALAALAVVVRREERVRPGRTFLQGMAPPAQPPATAAGVAAAGSMYITVMPV